MNVNDYFERRKIIGFITCFPETVIPELNDYDFIFCCDSNVVKFYPEYKNFVNSTSNNKALYVTSGYYVGNKDNLDMELQRSLNNTRWCYNFDMMKICFKKYKKMLLDLNIKTENCVVCSAKYIGWNMKTKDNIAKFVYEEITKNLQGNIIFSVAMQLFKDETAHFRNGFFGGKVNSHNKNY